MYRALASAAVLSLLLTGCYRATRPPQIGTVAPDFTVQDSDRKVSLSDLRGKVVVLNFWASWCPPCIEETPSLIQMQHLMKNRDVVVFAVSVDEDNELYQKFLRDYNMDLLTVRDAGQKSNKLYGTVKFPETYVIDRSGKIRRKFISAVQWNDPEILDFLIKLSS